MRKTQGVRLSSDGETINMSEGEGSGPGPGMERLTFPDRAGWERELTLGIWWDHWGETQERQKRPEGSWPGQTKSEIGTTKRSQCPARLKDNNMRLWESVKCTQGDPLQGTVGAGLSQTLRSCLREPGWENRAPRVTLWRKIPSLFFFFLEGTTERSWGTEHSIWPWWPCGLRLEVGSPWVFRGFCGHV